MQWYVGIDLSKDYIQISAMEDRMREPETFSQDKDSERYQIPTALAQKVATGDWLFGEEALALIDNDQYIVIDDIYGMALRKEKVNMRGEIIDCGILFGLLLQRCINLIFARHRNVDLAKVVFTVREINDDIIALIDEAAERLRLPRELVSLQDYKESFYFYALSAFPELCNYEVILYDYTDSNLSSYTLKLDHHTSPKIVMIHKQDYPGFGKGVFGANKRGESLDIAFNDLVANEFEGRMISCVYLVGDGFDEGWMEESTKILCHNRRVFLGKNLYTKGAVFSAVAGKNRPWDYVFLGEEKTKANVCLPIIRDGRRKLVTLVSAGENWYETKGCLNLILEEGNELTIVLRTPDGSATKEEVLPLTGLIERPKRTTRLMVEAKPVAKDKIYIAVTDEGFGNLYPPTGLKWEFQVTI